MKTHRRISRRQCSRLLLITGCASLTKGCLGPTLPLPPPEAPEQIALANGQSNVWNVRGFCSRGAVVLVENLKTGRITGVSDDSASGSYLVQVEGTPCDEAAVWELLGDDVSERTFFLLQPLQNGLPEDESCG